MYRVYRNQAAAAYLFLYFSFFFSSNVQTLKFFVTLFSGTVRPKRLKLITYMENVKCIVYTRIMLLLLFVPLCFFLSSFRTLKFFVTLFAGTVRSRRLKLGTHMESGQMYRVYQNQAAAAYSSLFLRFSFSPIFKHWNFSSHFSQKLWGLEGWNLVHRWIVGRCVMCIGIRLLLLIRPCIFHLSFSSDRAIAGL